MSVGFLYNWDARNAIMEFPKFIPNPLHFNLLEAAMYPRGRELGIKNAS